MPDFRFPPIPEPAHFELVEHSTQMDFELKSVQYAVDLDQEIRVSFEIFVEGDAPFMGLPGEITLGVEDTLLLVSAEAPHLSFPFIVLEAPDLAVRVFGEAPDLNLYPAKLAILDSCIFLTSESPDIGLGDLPRGLELIDNGDGTAHIVGTPAPGTAGIYRLTLKAVNAKGEREQEFWLRITDG